MLSDYFLFSHFPSWNVKAVFVHLLLSWSLFVWKNCKYQYQTSFGLFVMLGWVHCMLFYNLYSMSSRICFLTECSSSVTPCIVHTLCIEKICTWSINSFCMLQVQMHGIWKWKYLYNTVILIDISQVWYYSRIMWILPLLHPVLHRSLWGRYSSSLQYVNSLRKH